MPANLPEQVELTTLDALWGWFEANHTQPDGIHLVTWKAKHRDKYIGREDVLDVLIAYGWVDGRRFVVDDNRTAQLLSPRKQQAWSQSYKDRADKLRAAGRMQPAGERAIADGKASGLWDFFADVDALIVPDDLGAQIDRPTWDALAPSYRRNLLRWVKLAKTAKTRTKRIETIATATARGEKIPQM